MLTIFSNPRPFRGRFDFIQRNAILNWKKICPACEIILFDDEEHTSVEVAEELCVQCVTDVECNEFGTPLLACEFHTMRAQAKYPILAQINTDIILTSSFANALAIVLSNLPGRQFFMIGRRWDLEIDGLIDFENNKWEEDIMARVHTSGALHGMSGIDYWLFPRDVPFNPPPFVVGRPGMDSWLVYRARTLRIPVIDATEVATIIHQNHNYPQKKQTFFQIECERNLALAGGYEYGMSLRDADWMLTGNGLEKPKFPRRFYSILSMCYPWRYALSLKRRLYRIIT
jgi:hypothetical protein